MNTNLKIFTRIINIKMRTYSQIYYENYYKDVIKHKVKYCSVCDKNVQAWNMYKHNKSQKHQFNAMSITEKNLYLINRDKERAQKKIDRIKKSLQCKYSCGGCSQLL
jgi:5-bromo-4-chloroindolyl phosphate hydrolysis protein